jgi:hypothetical protein
LSTNDNFFPNFPLNFDESNTHKLSVNVFVYDVKVLSFRAVDSRFPVANQMALIKDRALGTEERVGSAIGLAHVENLKKVLA